jgi:hypothetical protein
MRSLNPILNYLLECRYQAKLILEQVPLSAIRQAASNERQALRLATEVETIGNEAPQLGSYKFNAAKIKPTLIELENIPANTLFNSKAGSVIETELSNSINQLTSKSPTSKTAKDLYVEIRTSRPELFNNQHGDEISNRLYDMVLSKTDEVSRTPPIAPIVIPDKPDPAETPVVPPIRPLPLEVPPSPYTPPAIPKTEPETNLQTNTSASEQNFPLGYLAINTLTVPLAQTDSALRRPTEPTNGRVRIPSGNNQNNTNQYSEEDHDTITVSGDINNIDDVDLELNKILGKYSGNYRIK